MRSYQDDGEHYDGQLGSEPTPADFLAALWSVTDELWRVLKPTGSLFLNLGDKYSGSGGHNNAAIGGEGRGPGRYNQSADVPVKSLMGLPWRYALGLTCPGTYRHDGVADAPQWTLRAEVIWSKPSAMPEPVTDRVRRSHEQWFHLTKQGRYYAAVDEIREAHTVSTMERGGGRNGLRVKDETNPSGTIEEGRQGWEGGVNPLGKLPGSVWTIPSEPLKVPDHIGVDHFAAFPQEWVRRLVLGWTPSGICVKCREGRRPVVEKKLTNVWHDKPVQDTKFGEVDAHRNGRLAPDDPMMSTYGSTEATITGYRCACDVNLARTRPAIVFDPFVGTGTVPMVARALGRYGIGLDLSRDYLRLATWRIGESRHGAKSINRTNRERQGHLW